MMHFAIARDICHLTSRAIYLGAHYLTWQIELVNWYIEGDHRTSLVEKREPIFFTAKGHH